MITVEIPELSQQPNLSLLSLTGREILKKQITQTKTLTDISTLQGGLYKVKIINAATVNVEKFIIP